MEHLQRTEGPAQLVPIHPQAGRHAFWPLTTLTKRIQEACLYDHPVNSELCLDWAHKLASGPVDVLRLRYFWTDLRRKQSRSRLIS